MSFDIVSVDGIVFGFDATTSICEDIVIKENRELEVDATSLYHPLNSGMSMWLVKLYTVGSRTDHDKIKPRSIGKNVI